MVNHPPHYGDENDPYEHIKVMEAELTREEFVGAMKFNISKYMRRERSKNGFEDVRKAQWYMNRLVDYLRARQPDAPWVPDVGRAGPPSPRKHEYPPRPSGLMEPIDITNPPILRNADTLPRD